MQKYLNIIGKMIYFLYAAESLFTLTSLVCAHIKVNFYCMNGGGLEITKMQCVCTFVKIELNEKNERILS